MRRLHLFEFCDLNSPAILRNMSPEFLEAMWRKTRLTKAVAPRVATFLQQSGTRQLVDLCAGASGPLSGVLQCLAQDGISADAVMTDKFPNLEAFERARRLSNGRLTYVSESVDATQISPEIKGARTLFCGLHHFRPPSARAILQDAVRQRAPIAIFEITERTWQSLLGVCLIPFMVLLLTPFIRPFRWSRLLLTYLVPLAPLLIFWDSVVSCFRSYRPDELQRLVQGLEGPSYSWEMGRLSEHAPAIAYFLGYPAKEMQS
jgi:hypothetical protein